jgi:hypothetical protein
VRKKYRQFRFEAVTTVVVKNTGVRSVMPLSVVEVYRHFGGHTASIVKRCRINRARMRVLSLAFLADPENGGSMFPRTLETR